MACVRKAISRIGEHGKEGKEGMEDWKDGWKEWSTETQIRVPHVMINHRGARVRREI